MLTAPNLVSKMTFSRGVDDKRLGLLVITRASTNTWYNVEGANKAGMVTTNGVAASDLEASTIPIPATSFGSAVLASVAPQSLSANQ